MNRPKVSVIMGVYNCETTLAAAIDSILHQTYPHWELVMCDDGSTDGTYALAEKYQRKYPEKIVLLKNEQNRKLSYTLNRCLKAATGELIARMDGDDISHPDRFERQVEYLSSHPDIQLVGTSMQCFDEAGLHHVRHAAPCPDPTMMGRKEPFFHPTILTYKNVYDRLGGYSDYRWVERAEDLELYFRFYHEGFKGENIDDVLYYVRENYSTLKRRTIRNRINGFRTLVFGYTLLGFPKRKLIRPAVATAVKSLVPTFIILKLRQMTGKSGKGIRSARSDSPEPKNIESFNERGILVISLDFELLWGLLGTSDPFKYTQSVAGARKAIPKLLSLFEKYDIHATWGIVGLLMQKSIQTCSSNLPEIMPNYDQPSLSAYSHFDLLKECDNQLLFADELVEMIGRSQNQEIGTHTYSHYYCMESGQTKEAFECDLQLAKKAVCDHAKSVRSIIFPRNQFNPAYADVMIKNGILNYRGNEDAWVYRSCETKKKDISVKRLLRLFDAYTGVFGNHCYPISSIREASGLNNIRSSRFFRPYSKYMAALEPLRVRRICKQMTFAAKHDQVFHLWFHPHNFGCNMERNLQNLEVLLMHFHDLKLQYGMVSLNMGELGDIVP